MSSPDRTDDEPSIPSTDDNAHGFIHKAAVISLIAAIVIVVAIVVAVNVVTHNNRGGEPPASPVDTTSGPSEPGTNTGTAQNTEPQAIGLDPAPAAGQYDCAATGAGATTDFVLTIDSDGSVTYGDDTPLIVTSSNTATSQNTDGSTITWTFSNVSKYGGFNVEDSSGVKANCTILR